MRWTPFSTLLLTGSPRLLWRVVPWAGAVVAVKALLTALGAQPLAYSPLLATAISAEVFVVGFLLTGTATDFKEAERLPGELAASLETITSHLLTAVEQGSDRAGAELERVLIIGRRIQEWLGHDSDLAPVMDELHRLHVGTIGVTELATQITALNNEQAAIRRTLLRMATMRRTSYVAAGYLVGEVVAIALLGVLLVTDLGQEAMALLVVGLVAYLLLYVVALIRDLDNPFEYRDGRPGDADVDLVMLRGAMLHVGDMVARDDE